MILLVICGLLFLSYSLLVLLFWYRWKNITVYSGGSGLPHSKVSIIIPARNEEQNIGRLLNALTRQDYPLDLYEIIVVDDHSTDKTAKVVKDYPGVRLISLSDTETSNSYKKKAIETGIDAAAGELIVTTDADCIPPPGWLKYITGFAEEKKSVFVAAPVLMKHKASLLQIFQTMDFMVLQGITGAAVHNKKLSMCNGANIAYTKEAFKKVNGFTGIDDIASGDDMLLMYKIWNQYPYGVHYLKAQEAIVSTLPQTTWKDFFNQRIRWASKAGKYQDKRLFPVLLLVYLFNLVFPVLFIAACISPCYWKWLLILWAGKTLVELPLFTSAAVFFRQQSTIKWFFFFQPLHILYTVISGFFGQMGKYEWKGRKVK